DNNLPAAGNDDEVQLASGSDVRSQSPPKPSTAFHSGKARRQSRNENSNGLRRGAGVDPPDRFDLAPGPRLVLPLLPEGNEWLKRKWHQPTRVIAGLGRQENRGVFG